MKKLTLAALLLVLSIGFAMASDPRLDAMGGIGISVSGTNMQSYPNPAAVFFDDNDYTFAFRGRMEDFLGVGPWPYLPDGSMGALFAAEMITMGIDVALLTSNPVEENDHVDSFLESSLYVNFCAGYGPFSAGVGVSGGSLRQRLDVPMSTLTDLAMQTLFAQYDRVVNSEYIQVNAGFMLKMGEFSAGVLLDNLLDKEGSSTTFNLRSILKETGVGLYWSRKEYSARGKMNNFVFSAGLEFGNLFDKESRNVHAGGEVKFRLVRDSSISLRMGFFGDLEYLRFGIITTGLAVAFRNVEIALNVNASLDSFMTVQAYTTLLF